MTHSEKALETLSLLGLTPADCGLMPIKWVREWRMIPTKVDCPMCYGRGTVKVEADGKTPAVNPFSYEKDWAKQHARQNEINALEYGRCPTCPQARSRMNGPYRGNRGTGFVIKPVKRQVMIGYLQMAEGSKWDSRFSDGLHCHLCNKLILKSGRVPVHGKSANGEVHNLWVGEDCATRFGGVEKKFKANEFLDENLDKTQEVAK